jgi:hypothetical protein
MSSPQDTEVEQMRVPHHKAPSADQHQQTEKVRNRRRNRRSTSNTTKTRVPVPAGGHVTLNNLSTRQSPQVNDPVICDEFCIDGYDLLPVTPRPRFAVQHQGYADIVRVAYEQLLATNRYLTQHLPASVFSYYCWILLHARLNELNKLQRFTYDSDFDQLVFNGSGYQVPDVISKYLRGLGEVISPANEKFQLAPLLGALNNEGHYGQFTSDTSVFYQQVAAPAICIRNMRADVAHNHAPVWDLGDIAPNADANNTVRANENLLGFQVSTPPAPRDRATYARLGISSVDGPHDVMTRFQFSPSVMQHVNSYFQANASVKMSEFSPGLVSGSLCQIMAVDVPCPDLHIHGQRYISQMVEVVSSFRLPSSTTSSGLITAYRVMEHSTSDDFLPHLGFTFHNSADPTVEVPPHPTYRDQINAVYNSENNDRLNAIWFRTRVQERYTAVVQAVRSLG